MKAVEFAYREFWLSKSLYTENYETFTIVLHNGVQITKTSQIYCIKVAKIAKCMIYFKLFWIE